MTVTAGSAKRVGPSEGSRNGRIAAGTTAPSRAEWCFVYVVLVAASVIPGLSSKYHLPSQLEIQIFWSVAYLIAGRQLLLMRTQVQLLVRRYAALWTLIALLFASTLWSVVPNVTIIDSIELLGTTLIGLYIATRFTLPEFLRILAMAFATIGALSLLIVLANPGFGRANWGTGPWQGIFEDKNISGAMEALAIISQVVLLPITKGRERLALLAGILLAGLLLAESNSATAFGGCAVVVVAALATFACRSKRFGGIARFATVLGIVTLVASVFTFGLSIDSVYSALGRSPDLTTRTDFWPYLQQAIADRPLLGYGFDAFFQSPLRSDYLAAFIVEAGGWTPYHAHDSFLQTALDVGYVGLVLLIVVLLIALWKSIAYLSIERRGVGIWPLTIIVFLTIGSYTETYYLNNNSLEWILFMAAIAYPRQPVEETDILDGDAAAPVPSAARVVARKRSDRL